MSEETVPEAASPPPPPQGQQYLDRFSEDDPEYLRLRSRAADLRQDFNLMEQKKRVTMILESPSFREELEGLIQEQMKKGNNSSNIWALRQIADFMASTSHAVFPASSMNFSMMTPINDLHTADSLNLAKGERLMRCKISSVYRLLDLYGWAQLSDTYVTLRVSKEQDHFLISPKGVSCNEVTASSLVSIVGHLIAHCLLKRQQSTVTGHLQISHCRPIPHGACSLVGQRRHMAPKQNTHSTTQP